MPRSVSVVVSARNDDHGGNFLRRFRVFAESLLAQAARAGLAGELIVVDWNSPDGSAPLGEAAALNEAPAHFPVRFIEVPHELHLRLPNSDRIPFFQMISKNVGIRRAHGEYVLATNCDVLFSNELVEYLAHGPLHPRQMYRLDRLDVAPDVPEEAPVDDRLRWCRRNVIRRHTWLRSRILNEKFRLDSRDWFESLDGLVSRCVRLLAYWLKGRWKPLIAHTNACGDFTLLARDVWHALRGYPELPLWSMHLDSLLCYNAVASGMRQIILRDPVRLYHMEHGKGWAGLTVPEKYRIFGQRPWIDMGLVEELRREMARTGEPILFNGPGWGLADAVLAEYPEEQLAHVSERQH